ncbi:hypothetical protein QC762_210210 [Podospora pseudocomata]|uniref:Uncharacterized protein n=1 Tax=Podospora pseudocomata TaxID=2093779 RepID=A0ABR0GN91_9PEZI|nr:hypothetical protein QC762_210210 [Podospora pseudocomata]
MDEATLKSLSARMKRRAHLDHNSRLGFSARQKTTAHYTLLIRAMRNVLSSKLAQFTYAQIIDGLPIEDVAWDQRIPAVCGNHPIEHHPELCPGALEFALEYKDKLDFKLLSFPRELTTKYVQSTPDSKVFNTRLIELVAMALNEIGVLLFDVGIEVHQGTGDRSIEAITHWKQDPDDETPPTTFHHPYYLHGDIYPLGVSNLVGYWAEDRILGGVVTFDRKAEEQNLAQPPNVYIVPSRAGTTPRYWQLLDSQQEGLVDFFLKEDDAGEGPLPLMCTEENKVRIDERFAVVLRGGYRDVWERLPPSEEHMRHMDWRPRREGDCPRMERCI